MTISNLTRQARAARETQQTATRLRHQANEKRQAAATAQAEAEAQIKARLKQLNKTDASLQEIISQEKEAKTSPRYKEAENSFNEIKKELGLNDLAQAKKDRNAELKEQVNADPEIAPLLEQAQQLELAAQQLEDQAAAMEPAAEAAIDEIIVTLANGQVS